MYRRSPILRAALSPTSQVNQPRNTLNDRIEQQLSKMRLMNVLDSSLPVPTSTQSLKAQVMASEETLMLEIQRLQSVVTELISLFQEFRTSLDDQWQQSAAGLEEKIQRYVDSKLWDIKQELELKVPTQYTEINTLEKQQLTQEISRLKTEIIRLREDQHRLEEKIRRINFLNCQAHGKSSVSLKAVRELLIKKGT